MRRTSTRGKKGIPHDDPADPPRPRDVRQRPAPSGRVVGRDSGEARLEVVDRADGATLEEVVQCATLEGTTVYTDEWRGYTGLASLRWGHVAVSQAGPRRSSKSCPPVMAVRVVRAGPRPDDAGSRRRPRRLRDIRLP